MRPLEEVPSFSCSYALQRGMMPASQVSPGRPSTSSLHACTPAHRPQSDQRWQAGSTAQWPHLPTLVGRA